LIFPGSGTIGAMDLLESAACVHGICTRSPAGHPLGGHHRRKML
jgi:hypothetical protein